MLHRNIFFLFMKDSDVEFPIKKETVVDGVGKSLIVYSYH